MKSRLIIFLSIIANLVFSQNVEQITIPKGVVYNYCSNEKNEEAKQLIINSLKQDHNYEILQNNLMIGHLLWKRFKDVEILKTIENGKVIFRIDNLEVEGKMCNDIEDSKKIWDELKKEVTDSFKIRKANVPELKYYWSTISFDIDEPLFVLETPNHNYILNFIKKDMKLFWIDEIPINKSYYNPIENKNYLADGGFKTYQNGKEVTGNLKGNKETSLEKVVLLNSNKELEENTSIEDIQLVINKTNLIFEELFKYSEKAGKIMIQFELNKRKNVITFAVRDDIDLDIMKEFEKRINSENYPNSKKKFVKLQLIYKVNSYNDVN